MLRLFTWRETKRVKMAAIEYDALITADQNLQYQQNLATLHYEHIRKYLGIAP
jgi:hypothetical protein